MAAASTSAAAIVSGGIVATVILINANEPPQRVDAEPELAIRPRRCDAGDHGRLPPRKCRVALLTSEWSPGLAEIRRGPRGQAGRVRLHLSAAAAAAEVGAIEAFAEPVELDRETCDRTRLARDPRFEGRFFSGVRTTRGLLPAGLLGKARTVAQRRLYYDRRRGQARRFPAVPARLAAAAAAREGVRLQKRHWFALVAHR
jgi:hypothetical protein